MAKKCKISMYVEKELLRSFKKKCIDEDKNYSRKFEEILKESI